MSNCHPECRNCAGCLMEPQEPEPSPHCENCDALQACLDRTEKARRRAEYRGVKDRAEYARMKAALAAKTKEYNELLNPPQPARGVVNVGSAMPCHNCGGPSTRIMPLKCDYCDPKK